MWRTVLVLTGLLVAIGSSFAATPVDLIDALNTGQVWAEFHGAGDRNVTGTVSRSDERPLSLQIAPGTQFWAQRGQRQGQTTLGSVPVDLTDVKTIRLTLETCCTNLNLPAATPEDIMLPVRCPDARLARVLSLPEIEAKPRLAVQTAVWAIANNPRRFDLRQALRSYPEAGKTSAERSRFTDVTLSLAADLLQAAGLDPSAFRAYH